MTIRSLTWRSPSACRCMVLAVIALLVAFQQYPSLTTYFMADDFGWLRFAKSFSNLWALARSPSPGGWTTPVCNVVFYALFRTFGFSPQGYYIFNGILHLCNTLLVYWLVCIITKQERLGLGSAAIFALHFIHYSDWGPMVWISAYVQIVVAFFYLLCLVLFVRYLQAKKWYFYVGALLCCGLALASKETALSLPLALLASLVFLVRKPVWRSPRVAFSLLPFVALWGAYLLHELVFQLSGHYVGQGIYGFGPHLISNWGYFSNLIVPNPDSAPVRSYLIRSFPVWVLQRARGTVIGIRIALPVAWVGLLWKGSRRIRFWLALMLITYLPFIGFRSVMAGPHRYFYLPSVGFAALLAEFLWRGFDWLSQKRSLAFACVVAAAVGMGMWGYSLLPSRTWERHMQKNSGIKRGVVETVGQYMTGAEIPMRLVLLVGFPESGVGDLPNALRIFYDIETVFVANGEEYEDGQDTLVLVYGNDTFSPRRP